MPDHPITAKDSVDFRDHIYQPALVRLAPEILPNPEFIRVRDQGQEGSCPGFGLAAVVDYLGFQRARESDVKHESVSARMLYEMAKLHDRWPGEDYEGSSLRGAMKGWHKNGVCSEKAWEYQPNNPGYLTTDRRKEARACPLGAYYRIMPKLSNLHAALNEVPAIFASAQTHDGWNNPGKDGAIPYARDSEAHGGHAFAIIGYTKNGFIVLNSWNESWGGLVLGESSVGGLAVWTYEDFEDNLWDAWVARMALPAPTTIDPGSSRFEAAPGGTRRAEKGPPRDLIAGHYIHIDDGQFDPKGDYPSNPREVGEAIETAFSGTVDHVLLYAHGGLNSVKGSAARAGKWRPVFKANGVHEIHFIWETGLIAELRDVLLGKETFANDRAGGFTDWTDGWLERATQPIGHALWKEMRTDAEIAFLEERSNPEARRTPAGTATLRMIVDAYQRLNADKRPKIHLVGHSAGSILFSHLLSRWAAMNGPAIETLVLFAPACTHDLVETHIAPALTRQDSGVRALHQFQLTDLAERDDNVAAVYRKSLLYLVSRAYQKKIGRPVPLMGLEKHNGDLHAILQGASHTTYLAPNDSDSSRSTSHGDFDNDRVTMNKMLSLILSQEPALSFSDQDMRGY